MRPLSPSPASRRSPPRPAGAQLGRGVRGAGEHAPTSLDYVAATAVGLMVLVLALAVARAGSAP